MKKVWTLFLDRDGIINEKIPDGYVKNFSEFVFRKGFLEFISHITVKFKYIFIVTNQQGIGKNLMTIEDLDVVHSKMIEKINNIYGRIDKIYFCPHLDKDNCVCRKPKTGMAKSAMQDFPEIDFKTSILIGDSASDIEFGKNIGAVTILINSSSVCSNADYCTSNFDEAEKIINQLVG